MIHLLVGWLLGLLTTYLVLEITLNLEDEESVLSKFVINQFKDKNDNI